VKTHYLDRVSSIADAKSALGSLLCENASTWLLRAADGDVIAYFNVVESDIELIGPAVTADVSGRHYNEDAAVIGVLKELQKKIGGVLGYAP